MEYKYTLETEMPINVTITLHEIGSLIEMLEPIAKDDGHTHRWQASRLVRELRQMKRSALSSSSSQLTYMFEKLERKSDASF